MACLAKAYGMKVLALRRRPHLSSSDPLVDEIVGIDGISQLFSASDFVIVCAALTPETINLVNSDTFSKSKSEQVLVNIGRGPIVNQEALITALRGWFYTFSFHLY